MEKPVPLSIRSPNRPNPASILKKTIQTPSTIRKTTTTTTAIANSKLLSPGKQSSPTRQWASRSMQSPTKTPKPRPTSMIEESKSIPTAPSTIRANPPSTMQRVHRMFNSSQDTFQTPCRPPPTASNDLLISFDTPSQNPLTTEIPGTSQKTLLDLDSDDLLGPTPNKSSREKYNDDTSLTDFISSTLEAERSKWIHEADMRHAAEMEALAADLHTQYREKHTRKVEALKVTYKRQYEKKITGLEGKVKELEGVIEELKEELEKEVKEKRELMEMSEELMRLTGTGNGGN